MPSKSWSSGDVLNAADVNSILANQVVMTFADSAARDAGFGGAGEPTLADGMVCYLLTDEFQIYDGSEWVTLLNTDLGQPKVVQVVTDKTEDAYTTTSTAFVQITDLTVDITPQLSSSTLLVIGTFQVGHSEGTGGFIQVQRGGAAIRLDPAGWFYTGSTNSDYSGATVTIVCKELPASVSEQNFTCWYRGEGATGVAINRSFAGTAGQVGPSTLTVLELSG